jgi:hypothetical protein
MLTKSRVRRGLVVLEVDEYGVAQTRRVEAEFALARCRSCGRRSRVLPSDVLPHKTYGLAVIEHVVAQYATWKHSLRTVAWSLPGEHALAYSTLHAWTEGLGAYALGRSIGEVAGADPFAAVLRETKTRCPEVGEIARKEGSVDPRRYRSEPRRERLEVLPSCLEVARQVDDGSLAGGPLCAWRRRALGFSLSSPFSFRTGLSRTAFERIHSRKRDPAGQTAAAGGRPCETRTRSPPGDTTRSPRSSIRL